MPSWFIKFKVYHLLFWAAYHFAWWSIAIGSPLEAANNIFFSPYTIKFVFYVVFQALGVYFNLYYLMPKLLEKDKYITYIAAVVATILSSATFIVCGYYLTAYLSELTFEALFNVKENAFWQLFKSNALPSTAASMTLAMSIKLGRKWIKVQKRQQLLEKEKIETELKFLKSQFNPHFLFNTINSIFVLIHKNPDMASESLSKFSDLLRYQLYECNEPRIPLERELDYLWNFIELGSLRLGDEVHRKVHLAETPNANLTIAPFILMPLIENAFKHVSQRRSENWLEINLRLENDLLILEVANSINSLDNQLESLQEYRGIGLQNVQRRLDLIYANYHSMEIVKNESEFKVLLQIQLLKNENLHETSPFLKAEQQY